jgi:DNA-binding HxlR family transcriptional regulator
MSTHAATSRADEASDRADDSTTETLIELLSDEYARDVLGTVRNEAKSARAIAEECGASRPTVYRRLDRLQEAGLVAEQMRHDAGGHHHRTFSATVESVGIELGDGGFDVALTEAGTGSSLHG